MTFWRTNWLRSAKRMAFAFLQLPCKEKQLLAKAMLILWAVRIALWTLPFRTLYRSIVEHEGSHKSPSDKCHDDSSAHKIVWAVRSASMFVPRASCLTQALAAQILLSDSGYYADLRIGVARSGTSGTDPLTAHAWLEKDGKVILGGPMCDYKPLSLEGIVL
jgi:hypothetical protein